MTDENHPKNPLVIRGKAITEDAQGRICLDDLWELAEAKPTKKPTLWRIGAAAKALISALSKKIRNSNINADPGKMIEAKRGRGQKGTFAHPILAAAYAGYLNPDLEVEMREVWLRYRAGDATLADEILQRATAEDNYWAGIRALARSNRVNFTDVLKAHGVEGRGYMECTEATYLHLLGGRSWEVRAKRGWPKGNLRDQLNAHELTFVMAAESLAAERISEEERQGNAQCVEASAIGANVIRTALEADRRNRQQRLPGA